MMQVHRARGGVLWKLLFLIAFLLMVGAVYLLRKPLLTETARLFIVDDKLQPADAIIVLGDDNFQGDRARHAAHLYEQRWAPRVIASGHYLRPYASVAELIRRDLIQDGVADEHVIALSHSASNTREEAYALRKFILLQRWRRIIVVTSNYHTSRSRYIFLRVMGPDVQVLVSAAEDAGFEPTRWWHSRSSIKLLARECFAWPVAMWEMSGDQGDAARATADPEPAR